jgi:hypothetical protein
MYVGDENMKNGKSPTKRQKITIAQAGLDASMWLVSKAEAHVLTLVHRYTNNVKQVIL